MRTITGTLGLAPLIVEKDLYEDTRKFPLVYDPAEDPVVVAEMEQMETDLKAGHLEKEIEDPDPSGSDLSDSDDDEDLWVDEEPEVAADGSGFEELPPTTVPKAKGKAKKGKKLKPKKVFTPVDKVVFLATFTISLCPQCFQIHASVVHILRSEIRRKKARVLIHKQADKEYRHLVFMRSMVIRWNTMYAEMRRARNLSPVRKLS